MSVLHQRLLAGLDRTQAFLITLILVGTTLAFGGAVWWARFALAVAVVLLVASSLVRVALSGKLRLLRSPLGLIGLLSLVLAVVQLAPLPSGLAARVSGRAREVHVAATGDVVGRSTATVDRPATLRWLGGASAGLALFCVVAHFADRLGHLKVVWGSVVTAFGICTLFGALQLVAQGSGLYGAIVPGRAPAWAPSVAELVETPGTTRLRPTSSREGEGPWVLPRPEPAFAIGPLVGGPGAYLALATLGMPLALGLTLQSLAPRGSRERLLVRLREQGGLSRLVLLVMVLIIGSTLVGFLGGPWLGLPIALGVTVAGLASIRGTGVHVAALTLTSVCLLAVVGGTRLGMVFGSADWVGPTRRGVGLGGSPSCLVGCSTDRT